MSSNLRHQIVTHVENDTAVNFFLPHSAQCAISAITSERIYIAPHPALQEYISHYTVYAPHKTLPSTLTLVPDASGAVVCRLAEEQGTWRVEARLFGPSSRAVTVENNPVKYPLYIMVEFLPCGANRLLGLPMHELLNGMIPLENAEIAGVQLHRILTECMERLATDLVHALPAVCATLNATFLRRLIHEDTSASARHVVDVLRRTNGTLRVEELSRQLGCSSRQLARIMGERLGMPAKLLTRIIRINAACRWMDAHAAPLTQLAHSLHYHDQSHFIHDFTDICGVTPGEYLSRMSHFYNEDLKLAGIVPKK